jgi:signal transduction histidine kinase
MTTRAQPTIAGSTVYLLFNLVTGVFWFSLLVTMLATSLGLLIIWVGFPLLVLTLLVTKGAATIERAWVRTTLGVEIPSPYRQIPEGSALVRARALMTDPAVWRDMGYLVLGLPLGIIEFTLVMVFVPTALALIAAPLYQVFLPTIEVDFGNGREWVFDSFTKSLPLTALGIVLALLTVPLLRGVARGHGKLALAMLGPTRTSVLSAEATRLHASRARGVESAEAERRRIERDLHDGAQQRLVAVAMSLGRAKTKLDTEPEAARELIAEAHADAKLAISELRDLARGIYPSVLGDRGLDPALSALAAKCPIPVDLTVDVEPRPPTAVESAAYFTVAETLTNIAKHASATRAEVKVTRTDSSVVVVVTDNGLGGAEVRPGGGLAGLADRAATIDGVVVVLSPIGGPTVIRTELPCAW